MFGKSGGSSVKGNSQDPFTMMMMSQMMNRSNPITTLPPSMVPTAPAAMTGGEVLGHGLAMEKPLHKHGLSITKQNPLFADNAPQAYADKYYNSAIQPLIDEAAIGQYMKGNIGSQGGNTVAGSYLSNAAVQGRKDAFFEGENWRNMQANMLFARRGQLFGQNNALVAQQNALDIQRSMGLNQDTTQRFGILNTSNSNAFNGFASAMNGGMDRNLQANQFNAQMQAQQKAAQMANLGNLAGGVMGIGTGLASGFMGGPMPGAGAAMGGGGGGGSAFTSPQISSSFLRGMY